MAAASLPASYRSLINNIRIKQPIYIGRPLNTLHRTTRFSAGMRTRIYSVWCLWKSHRGWKIVSRIDKTKSCVNRVPSETSQPNTRTELGRMEFAKGRNRSDHSCPEPETRPTIPNVDDGFRHQGPNLLTAVGVMHKLDAFWPIAVPPYEEDAIVLLTAGTMVRRPSL